MKISFRLNSKTDNDLIGIFRNFEKGELSNIIRNALRVVFVGGFYRNNILPKTPSPTLDSALDTNRDSVVDTKKTLHLTGPIVEGGREEVEPDVDSLLGRF